MRGPGDGIGLFHRRARKRLEDVQAGDAILWKNSGAVYPHIALIESKEPLKPGQARASLGVYDSRAEGKMDGLSGREWLMEKGKGAEEFIILVHALEREGLGWRTVFVCPLERT